MKKVFVCFACGKRSHDRYGNEPIDRGWDVSCVMNSEQVAEDQLVLKEGRVVEVLPEKDGERDETNKNN